MAQNRVLKVYKNITTFKEKDMGGIRCRLTPIRQGP